MNCPHGLESINCPQCALVDADRIGAKLNTVLAWATGRCECCAGMTDDKFGMRVYTERCYGCIKYSGDEDAPNLWRGAWEAPT